MRFIIREQEYEVPLAAGLLRYEANQQPTGKYESWRLTEIADGYRFLRVDLDSREASTGTSTLYHLVLNPNGEPERLKFRHFAPTTEIRGDVQLNGQVVTLNRNIAGRRFESEESLTAGTRFWFPSALGWALLARQENGAMTSVTLDSTRDFSLRRIEVNVERLDEEVLAVANEDLIAHRFLIKRDGQTRELWLDDHHLPVQIEGVGGLRAIETRYMRYKRRS